MFLSWLGAPLPPALHSNLIRAAAANKGSTQLEIVLWQQYSIFHPNWHVLCLATSCNRGRARPRLQAGNKTLFMSKRSDLEKKFNWEDVLREEESLFSTALVCVRPVYLITVSTQNVKSDNSRDEAQSRLQQPISLSPKQVQNFNSIWDIKSINNVQ